MDSIGLGEFVAIKSYFIIGAIAISIIAVYLLKSKHKLKKGNKTVLKIIIVLCMIIFLFNLFYLGKAIYLLNLYGV